MTTEGFYRALWKTGLFNTRMLEQQVQGKDADPHPWSNKELLLDLIRSDRPRPPFTRISVDIFTDSIESAEADGRPSTDLTCVTLGLFFDILRQSSVLTSSLIQHLVSKLLLNWNNIDAFSITLDAVGYVCLLFVYHSIASPGSPLGSLMEKWITGTIYSISNRRFSEALGTLLTICRGNLADIEELIIRYSISLQNLTQYERGLSFLVGMAHGYTYLQMKSYNSTILEAHCGSPPNNMVTLSQSIMKILPANSCLLQYQYMDLLSIVLPVNLWQPQVCSALTEFLNHMQALSHQVGYKLKTSMRVNPHGFLAVSIIRLCSRLKCFVQESLDLLKVKTQAQQSILVTLRTSFQRMQLLITDALNGQATVAVKNNIFLKDLQSTFPAMYTELIRPYCCAFIVLLDVCAYLNKIGLEIGLDTMDMQESLLIVWRSLIILDTPSLGRVDIKKDLYFHLASGFYCDSLLDFLLGNLTNSTSDNNFINRLTELSWSTLFKHLAFHTEPIPFVFSPDRKYSLEKDLSEGNLHHLRDSLIAELNFRSQSCRKTRDTINSIPDGYICGLYALTLIELYSVLWSGRASLSLAFNRKERSIIGRLNQYNIYGYLSRDPFNELVNFEGAIVGQMSEDKGGIYFLNDSSTNVPLYFSSSGPLDTDSCIISMGTTPDESLTSNKQSTDISTTIFFKFYAELFCSVYEQFSMYMFLEELLMHQEITYKWAPYCFATDPDTHTNTAPVFLIEDVPIPDALPDLLFRKFVFEIVNLLVSAEESVSLIEINIYLDFAGKLLQKLPDAKLSPYILNQYIRTGVSIYNKFKFIFSVSIDYFASVMSNAFFFEQLLTSAFVCNGGQSMLAMTPAINEFFSKLPTHNRFLSVAYANFINRVVLKHSGYDSFTSTTMSSNLSAILSRVLLKFTRNSLLQHHHHQLPDNNRLTNNESKYLVINQIEFSCLMTELREQLCKLPIWEYGKKAVSCLESMFDLLTTPPTALSVDSTKKVTRYILMKNNFLAEYVHDTFCIISQKISTVLIPVDFGFKDLIITMSGICTDAHTRKCGVQLNLYFSSRLIRLVVMMKRGMSPLLRPIVKGQNCTLETNMTQIQQPVEPDVNPLLMDSDEGCELLDALLVFISNELDFHLAVNPSIFCSDFVQVLISTWPIMLSIHGFSANMFLPHPFLDINPSMVPQLVPLKDTGISGYTLLTILRTLQNILHFNQFLMHNSNNLRLRSKYRFHLYRYSNKIVTELIGVRTKSSRSAKNSRKQAFDASLMVCYISFYYTKAIVARLLINLVFLLRCDKSNLLTHTDRYLAACLSEMHRINLYFCDTLSNESSTKPTVDNRQQSNYKIAIDPSTNRFSSELSLYTLNVMPLITKISQFSIANPASLYDNQTGNSGFKILEEDTVSTSVLKIIAALGRRHGETLDSSLNLMKCFIPLMDGAKIAIGWFVDVLQTYLHPMRTSLPKGSKIFTLSPTSDQYGNNLSSTSHLHTGCSSESQHIVSKAGLIWSYKHQSSIFNQYCMYKNAFTDTFYENTLSKEIVYTLINTTCYTDNHSYQRYINPYYISRSRSELEQQYQKRDEQERLPMISLPAILPNKIPLSADIIANSSSVMIILQILISVNLINANVLASFAEMLNKKSVFMELLNYTENCLLSPSKESWRHPTTAIELFAPPCKKMHTARQLLCMAVPSVSIACSLLNSYSCQEIRYVAALRFYYLSHIGKSKTILAYLLFLTNALHFDIYSGDLLINIASHSRLFGLYTLIQLSSLYSQFLTQQHSEIFLSVAVGKSAAEELLSIIKGITLDKLIVYIHGSPFAKQAEQQKYLAVRDVVMKRLANNGVTLRSITTNLLILFDYMRAESSLDNNPIYALYQQLMLSIPNTNHIVIRAYLLYLLILTAGSKEDALFYILNLHFYDIMTNFSAEVLRINASDRDQVLSQKLKEFSETLNTKGDIVLLSDPDYIITGICYQKAKCLKSHAKAPYLVFFNTIKSSTNANDHSLSGCGARKTIVKGGIFKAGDDVSQDQLTMVLISLFKQMFEPLRMWLSPYIALPIGKDYGFIELLNKASSLDQIGATSDNFLIGYVSSITGVNGDQSNSATYSSQKISLTVARRRFLLSYAGYSILSYLLSFKDRHNGNIMINEHCNLIHIDFGFLLDIAPGGKFNTEHAPFKLTKAFKTILGGEESTSYTLFQNIFVRGMLLSKMFGKDVSYLIEAMLKSNLPAIKGTGSITQFRQRMFLEDSFGSAVEQAVQLINESSKKGYGAYDKFQSWQNNITYG